jgi:hypothetical protein
MSNLYSDEVRKYYPYIVGMLIEDGFFASSSNGGTVGGGNDPDLTGYLKADGTIPLTGNLAVSSGKTIDGVDLSAFKSSYEGHLSGDSHPRYAEAEGYGTRAAAWANRLNKSVLAGTGISGGGLLDNNRTVSVDTAHAFTWTAKHTFNLGLAIDASHDIEFGADVTLGRAGADLLYTPDEFWARKIGANLDPVATLDVKAHSSDSPIARVVDSGNWDLFKVMPTGGALSGSVDFGVSTLYVTPAAPEYGGWGLVYNTTANSLGSGIFRIYETGLAFNSVELTANHTMKINGEDGRYIRLAGGYNRFSSTGDSYVEVYHSGQSAFLYNDLITVTNFFDNPAEFYGADSHIKLNAFYGILDVKAHSNSSLTTIKSRYPVTVEPNHESDVTLPHFYLKQKSGWTGDLFQIRNSANGIQGYVGVDFNWRFGIASSANDVRLQVRHATEQLRLENTDTKYTRFLHDSNNDLTIEPGNNLILQPLGDLVFNPTGNDIVPYLSYDLNLGTPFKKFLTIHAAELWVETLVAQDVLATVGGRVLVIPTTSLTRDLTDSATTIYVKHNQARPGDTLRLEARMRVEFMYVTAGPTEITPGAEYSYTVNRSVDPTGANAWLAGDGVVNTGIAGSGYIDLFALQGATVLSPDYVYNYAGFAGTFSANLRDERSFNIFGDGAPGAALYVGNPAAWANMYLTVETGDSGNGIIVFEYWNGSAWTIATPTVINPGVGNAIDTPGLWGWEWSGISLTGWTSTTVNGISAYWVRLRLSATGGSYTRALHGGRRLFTQRAMFGPTIAFMKRNSTTFNDITEHSAFGNLNGTYGYGRDIYGGAVGRYGASWLTADEANGLRLFADGDLMGQWKLDGSVIVGPESARHMKLTGTALQLKDGAGNVYTELAAALLRLGTTTNSYLELTDSAITFRNTSGTDLARLTNSEWRIGQTTVFHTLITSGSWIIRNNATDYASITASAITMGVTTDEHVRISSTGVELKDNATVYGKFAATTTVGRTDQNHAEITAGNFRVKDGAGVTWTDVSAGLIQVGRKGDGYSWLEASDTKIAMKVQKGVTISDTFWFNDDGDGFLDASLTVNSAGFIRLGRTSYSSGAGVWMGYDNPGFGAAYKMAIGDSAGAQLLWDGTDLTFQTDPSGARLLLRGDGLRAYNSSNVEQVHIDSADGSLKAAAGAAIINAAGVALGGSTSAYSPLLTFATAAPMSASIGAGAGQTAFGGGFFPLFQFRSDKTTYLDVTDTGGAFTVRIGSSTYYDGSTDEFSVVNDFVRIKNNLRFYRDSDYRTAHAYVPITPYTLSNNVATQGNQTTNITVPAIGTSSVPDGVKAVACRLIVKSTQTPASGHYVSLSEGGTSNHIAVVRPQVANLELEALGPIPVNGSKQIRINIAGFTGTPVTYSIVIVGYYP